MLINELSDKSNVTEILICIFHVEYQNKEEKYKIECGKTHTQLAFKSSGWVQASTQETDITGAPICLEDP